MKKLIIGAGLAIGLAVLAGTLVASAQTATSNASGEPAHPQPMILNIGRNGRVLMRGTIASIAGNILTVNSWGGAWTVNVGSSTDILPTASGLAGLGVNDFVGVEGTVSSNGPWTIDASLVRDWTARQALGTEVRQNVQEARQIRKANRPRDFVGTASNVSGTAFTLTANGAAYTVDVGSGTEVVNRNWIKMPLGSIQTNDKVRVWGTESSSTIVAQIVRDVSVPTTSSK